VETELSPAFNYSHTTASTVRSLTVDDEAKDVITAATAQRSTSHVICTRQQLNDNTAQNKPASLLMHVQF